MTQSGDYFMYVGTFTSDFTTATGELMGAPSEGIYVFDYDSSTGAITPRETIPGLCSPSWLAFHPTLPVLYACERRHEVEKPVPGALSSWAIDEETGHLEMTSRAPSEGASPPYVGVHRSGRHAYSPHFQGGQVVAYPLDEEGRVGDVDRLIQHRLTKIVYKDGVPPHHQEAPHPHMTRPSRNGRYITVTDVGMNAVLAYPTDPETGALSPTPSQRFTLPPGTGPRHHAIHPDGTYLFTCGELNSTLNVLALDEETGALRFVAALPTLPDDYVPGADHVGTAEVGVHPSGRAVYVSNRGHDSIAVYSFDPETGATRFLGTESSRGVTPRAFSVDPTGSYLIVANQTPGSLVRFRIDQETYWPTLDGDPIDTPTPVCIVFREKR